MNRFRSIPPVPALMHRVLPGSSRAPRARLTAKEGQQKCGLGQWCHLMVGGRALFPPAEIPPRCPSCPCPPGRRDPHWQRAQRLLGEEHRGLQPAGGGCLRNAAEKAGAVGRDRAQHRRQGCLQGLGGLMHHQAQGRASGAPGRSAHPLPRALGAVPGLEMMLLALF